MKDSMIYDKEIRMLARRLCKSDKFLAEEVRSEMHIAMLNLEEGQDKAFYLWVAKCRAIDYLRSKAKNYSYGGAVEHISLEAMREAGFQIDTERNVYEPDSSSSSSESVTFVGELDDP